ncbi:hypothetical protein B005_5389 [Nocardiopsis alba ATCC BAA-2165]|uniref:Uncharacterized protein n=1 Tax=Nocardiopsis alba (strain ATCC BAA-2165 / BE74) TaxID=1205910 RepID=J7L740_NOCAA|nr:hypothetical protein B005_5389 [Nocardiopsis alba ATCC BAA-2165]
MRVEDTLRSGPRSLRFVPRSPPGGVREAPAAFPTCENTV